MLIRVKSHRARDRMQTVLGYLPQGYFSWEYPGEFRDVPADEVAKLTDIPGLTRARVDLTQLRPYTNWG